MRQCFLILAHLQRLSETWWSEDADPAMTSPAFSYFLNKISKEDFYYNKLKTVSLCSTGSGSARIQLDLSGSESRKENRFVKKKKMNFVWKCWMFSFGGWKFLLKPRASLNGDQRWYVLHFFFKKLFFSTAHFSKFCSSLIWTWTRSWTPTELDTMNPHPQQFYKTMVVEPI